jgi:hypothetical protein
MSSAEFVTLIARKQNFHFENQVLTTMHDYGRLPTTA